MLKLDDLDPFYHKHTTFARVLTVISLIISPVILLRILWFNLKDEISQTVKEFYKGSIDFVLGRFEK